ncbi:uncharacterized protein LOC117318503 isoform X2 [Pecten maximus]|uniref:uncharacterized protein LOC117318503 isoform X2 n=1 Tax=Pecten maximus TaxID=6579 RepID=UPI0014587FE9|nr:uncharacterized protein LOC117318503 isoform X2 [Pecten maximus]
MEAIFIQDRVLLHSLMEAVDNINAGIGNGNVPCSALELQNVRMMEILQELCLIQYYNNEAIPTPVFDNEFWETLDLSALSVMIVPNGVYIFRRDDFGSVKEHQQMVSDVNQYARYMEEMLIAGNVVALEASDPAQDWISQEMIKPHVITIREMLKFTDVQIKNGLENLHRRGKVINFMNLLDTLILTEDAVVNVYVGTRKYAFSADVKLVLHECFDKYQREPTMEEFDQEWNRIKEHLINLLDIERTRAEQADTRAEQADTRAIQADTRAEQADTRAEQADTRAEQADTRAIRAHRERIEAMRQINTAMEDRNEAKEMMNAAIESLEEEKRRVEKRLLHEKMREQIRAEILEHEKRKLEEEKLLMAAKFEEEKRILLSRIQQISGCAQA